MGDLWEAYQFIGNATSTGSSGKMSLQTLQDAAAEMEMKQYLAEKQGIKDDVVDLNINYEIRMELVKRQTPLSAELVDMIKEIAKLRKL